MSASARVAVNARPEFEPEDRAWIDALRSAHDPQAARIGPHVTLAFPAPVTLAAAREELTSTAAECAPFACTFDAVLAVREPGTDGGHVYFVPSAGRAQLERLHDRLYLGAFRPHFRAEPRYVPHVTLGAHAEFARCVELAERLERESRVVRAVVTELELVDASVARVAVLARARLADPAR